MTENETATAEEIETTPSRLIQSLKQQVNSQANTDGHAAAELRLADEPMGVSSDELNQRIAEHNQACDAVQS